MRVASALTALGILSLLLGGCDNGTGDATPTRQVPPAVYSVRGVVESVPEPGRPMDWIAIHHEAIPEFIGITGEPEPMHAMTMRFPVAETVELGSVAAGDRIAFDLQIDWDAGDPARVLAITPLPPETELDFGASDAGHGDH